MAMFPHTALSSSIQDPFTIDKFAITPSAIRFLGAIPIGSRELGVNRGTHIDYDFVVLKKNWDLYIEGHNDRVAYYPINEYFEVVPSAGNNYLAKCHTNTANIDVIILENEGDMQIVSRAMRHLLSLPKKELTIKAWRITAFEKALLRYGFVRRIKNKQQGDKPL